MKKNGRDLSGRQCGWLHCLCLLLLVLFVGLVEVKWTEVARAEDTYTFTDREGNTVTVPVSAFASHVVSFQHGDPWRTAGSRNTDPQIALGLPDANDTDSSTGDLCLGRRGVLVLGFNSYIDDGDGNDVYVFEVGSYVESTEVEVSSDLKTWYKIGRVEGRTAGLDLRGKVPAGSRFRYVRLTDTGENPDGSWPGADIDTVCGLHSTQMSVSDYKKVAGNFNSYAVMNGPTAATTFTVPEGKALHLQAVTLYHWNYGSGQTPGEISIYKGTTLIGTWKANGRLGNTYWDIFPDILLEAGTYRITCSSNATWSYNGSSGNAGFAEIYGKIESMAPKATTLVSVKAAKKGFTVKWKKQKSGTTGYQIQYATNSKFTSGKKTVTVKGSGKTSRKITGLKAKKKYYVRIRTYKSVSGKKYVSAWSKAKTVVTKK